MIGWCVGTRIAWRTVSNAVGAVQWNAAAMEAGLRAKLERGEVTMAEFRSESAIPKLEPK